VIKESLRLHPGVGYPLERVVPKGGATLCGIDIPAGTVVGMHAWVIHHNRNVFGEDADEFRPERWLESGSGQLKKMERCFMSVSGFSSRDHSLLSIQA
jgi:cytochrome P450